MSRPFTCIALLLACSCSGTPRKSDPLPFKAAPTMVQLAAQPQPEALVLMEGWASLAPWDFEAYVLTLSPGLWSPQDRAALASHLDDKGLPSVHAALLLGYGDAPSAELLLLHLEIRRSELERADDAAEVLAARALRRFDSPDLRRRLVALSVAPTPHPDLEVRTECAALALSLSRREVIPFLLRVLHSGTPQEASDPIDWVTKKHLTWSKDRAAEALSDAAGLQNTFLADASWGHQKAQADRLAKALGFQP